MLRTILVFVVLARLVVAASRADDWPQFRGVNSAGVTESAAPTEFGPGKNELWSVPLASGHSSPCVAGDAIFLTTFDETDRRLAVLCLDRKNGAIRWRREIAAEEIETGHPSFNPASSTPAADGERVVAYFGSYGLVCFNPAGELLWELRLPVAKSYAGNATSPAIYGDRVILYRGNHVDHFLTAVDKRSGEVLWKVDQDEPFVSELACTACPIVVGDRLIVHSARAVQAVELATGRSLWTAKCATTATSTPVLAENEVLVAAWNKMGEPALRPSFPSFAELLSDQDADGDGRISRDEFPRLMIFHRPDGAEAPQNGASLGFRHADSGGDGLLDAEEWDGILRWLEEFRAGYETHGLLAIPLDGAGLVQRDHVRTLETQGIPEVPSPLYHDGVVYFVKNGGVLTCLDVASGRRLARVRTAGRGTHYASPIIAGDNLYSAAGSGVITVLGLTPAPHVLASNDLQDGVYATPAVADGVLYVRTHHRLFAFGLPSE